MKRLKQSEIMGARSYQASLQQWNCLLCDRPMRDDNMVFDHSHQTGKMRGVLHRNCNCLLGRIEMNCRRHCISFNDLPSWLRGCADYLEKPHLDIFHPSFRTEEEKKELRNKRAKRKRALKKNDNTNT